MREFDGNLFRTWIGLAPDERRDIEKISSTETKNMSFAEISYRVIHADDTKRNDLNKLHGILSDKHVKQIFSPEKNVATLEYVRGTKWVDDRESGTYMFSDNQLMSIKRFRLRFLRKRAQWANAKLQGLPNLPGMVWSEEARKQYADEFSQLIFNDYFLKADGGYAVTPEELTKALKGKRVQHYFEQLEEDLCLPFLEEEIDENGEETGYYTVAEGNLKIDDEKLTYAEVVDEIKGYYALPRKALMDEK